MATTLANLRAKLNGEIGVDTDGATAPWTTTVRNNAISDGYAALWRAGVWKVATQSISTADDTVFYALTSIRRIFRVEILDSSSRIIDQPKGHVEEDGSGGYQLVLQSPLSTGYTMLVRGFTAYKSVFANDSDTDDLPAEENRIPLLKAKAILYRGQLGRFAQYGERAAVAPAMGVTVDQLIGIIAACEREFIDEAKRATMRRPRVMQGSRSIST